MVEDIKVNNSKLSLLNVAVWPYASGEVITQNYNTVLSLASLIDHSDGVVSVFNDEVMRLCKQGKLMKNPSYLDMNSIISEHLLSVFFPTANSTSASASIR